jgi:hypothetical protein
MQANSRNGGAPLLPLPIHKETSGMIKEWIDINYFDTKDWLAEINIDTWWDNMSSKNTPNRKTMATLTMLTSWIIWNERNAKFPVINQPGRWFY